MAVGWSMLSLPLLRLLLRLGMLDVDQWDTLPLLFDLMLLENIVILLKSLSVLLRMLLGVIMRILMLLLP